MEILASKIKEKMLEHDISTYVLEKRAGLKHGAVQNIMYGRSKNPSIQLVRSIAQVFNCSIEDLIDDGEDLEISPASPEVSSQPTSYSSNPAQTKSTNEESWNQELYLQCFKTVHDIISKRKIVVEKKKIIDIAEEIYNYSHYNNLTYPDNNFASWLIGKHQLK